MQALVQLAPMIIILAVFYFLLIRPQQQKQKKHEAMIANLKKGDKVVTVGGVYGTVSGFKGDRVVLLKVANNVELEFVRNAISYLRDESNSNKAKETEVVELLEGETK